MFKKIVVAFITKKFQDKAFLVGLGIAQKFDGSVTVIDCVYRHPPKFAFFETKDDKKSYTSTKKQIQASLTKFEKIAKDTGFL